MDSDAAPAAPTSRVAVVGAGPSGLACAAELAQKGHEVVIFEKEKRAGGMVEYAIPEHRLSRSFVQKEINDVLALGVTLKSGVAISDERVRGAI